MSEYAVGTVIKGKGVRCEAGSEGSWRQTLGLTNRNHIVGIYETDEVAVQTEVQYCPNLVV